MRRGAVLFAAMLMSVSPGIVPHSAQAAPPLTSTTQVVLLGTGNPPVDPDRSGPATAIVVNDTPYLIDMGAGVVRRAKSAVVDKGVAGLDPLKLRVVFVTHLHSDHTVGYPDLWLTPWVLGRRAPLEVYGPVGIVPMTEHLMEVIHDWNDQDSLKILSQVRNAAPEGSKLLLVEQLMPEAPGPHWVKMLDIHMMALFAARQRSADEYHRLAEQCGFAPRGTVDTPAGISILEYERV